MRRPVVVAALVLVPLVALGGLLVVRLTELFADDAAAVSGAADEDEAPRALRAATRARVSDGDSDEPGVGLVRPRSLVLDPSLHGPSRSTLVSPDQARASARLDLPPERLLARSEARAAWRDRLSEEERELVRERLREKRNELTPEEREARRARREARQEALGVARSALDSD